MDGKVITTVLFLLLTINTVTDAQEPVWYDMVVSTQDRDHANTDDNIFVRVYGKRGFTDWYECNQPGVNDFERGQRDSYRFKDTDVGDVMCVEFKIDDNDAWLLNWVKISSPSSHEKLIQNREDQRLSTETDEGFWKYRWCNTAFGTSYRIWIKVYPSPNSGSTGTKDRLLVKVHGAKGWTEWTKLPFTELKQGKQHYGEFQGDIDVGDIMCVSFKPMGDDQVLLQSVSIESSGSRKKSITKTLLDAMRDAALHKDKRQFRWCHDGTGYGYNLDLTTWDQKNADTRHAPSVRVYGEKGLTSWEWIGQRGDFSRGSTDKIELYDYVDVGDIYCVEFKVEGADDLLLSKIRIASSTSETKTMYNPEEQWLSMDEKGKAKYSWCTKQGCVCTGINNEFWTGTVEFHTDQAEVVPLSSKIVDQSTLTEDSTSTLTVEEEYSETMSFSHSAGISVMIGTSVTAKIPKVAEVTTTVEVTTSYEFTYGKEKTVTKTIAKEYGCNGQNGKRTECIAFLHKQRTTLPYTMTWTKKYDKTCICTEEGVFTDDGARSEMLVTRTDL